MEIRYLYYLINKLIKQYNNLIKKLNKVTRLIKNLDIIDWKKDIQEKYVDIEDNSSKISLIKDYKKFKS